MELLFRSSRVNTRFRAVCAAVLRALCVHTRKSIQERPKIKKVDRKAKNAKISCVIPKSLTYTFGAIASHFLKYD